MTTILQKSPVGVVSSRLVRLREGSVVLRFEPPLICDCGGEVEVMDWKRSCEAGRYEAWCNKCQECDPNGWATQAEVIQNSPGYFQKANAFDVATKPAPDGFLKHE